MASSAGPHLGRGKIRMGTCGWSDQSLARCGRFYPPSAKTAEQRLAYYSSFWSCVEVDTMTYAICSPYKVQKWVEQVPAGFVFHFKAFGLFCAQSIQLQSMPKAIREMDSMQQKFGHLEATARVSSADLPPDALVATWQRYNEACAVAEASGKLGVIVFQFHLGFKPGATSEAVIRDCRERLKTSFQMAVEFRDRTWLSDANIDATCAFLSSCNAMLIACDDLVHEVYRGAGGEFGSASNRLLPVVIRATVPEAGLYIRLHRRDGCERVLSDEEFEEWGRRFDHVLGPGGMFAGSEGGADGGRTLPGYAWFMWGTDHEDQPIINAKKLAAACRPEYLFDWKGHLQEQRKKITGGIMSFVRITNANTNTRQDAAIPVKNQTDNQTECGPTHVGLKSSDIEGDASAHSAALVDGAGSVKDMKREKEEGGQGEVSGGSDDEAAAAAARSASGDVIRPSVSPDSANCSALHAHGVSSRAGGSSAAAVKHQDMEAEDKAVVGQRRGMKRGLPETDDGGDANEVLNLHDARSVGQEEIRTEASLQSNGARLNVKSDALERSPEPQMCASELRMHELIQREKKEGGRSPGKALGRDAGKKAKAAKMQHASIDSFFKKK